MQELSPWAENQVLILRSDGVNTMADDRQKELADQPSPEPCLKGVALGAGAIAIDTSGRTRSRRIAHATTEDQWPIHRTRREM